MSSSSSIQFSLNRFFDEIHIKKQYLKKVQNKAQFLNKLNCKNVGWEFSNTITKPLNNTFVMYVIEISFSKKKYTFPC